MIYFDAPVIKSNLDAVNPAWFLPENIQCWWTSWDYYYYSGDDWVPPHSSSVCVVLGREGGAQTAVDQQDDDGDGLLRRRKRSSGRCIFHRLIGRHADWRGWLIWMGCNRKSVSRHLLSSHLLVYRLVFLTFFVGSLPVLPVVVVLSLRHEGSGRHYDVRVRIPQRLTPEEGGVVSRETPPHVGLGLHAVQVHDWQKKRSKRENWWDKLKFTSLEIFSTSGHSQ